MGYSGGTCHEDGSVRLCSDYKITVNQATETDTYPLPRIEEMLTSVGHGTVFLKLDLPHIPAGSARGRSEGDGDHQHPQRVVPCESSAIQSGIGTLHVPTSNGSILQGLPGIIVYIDDILVSEKTVDKHLQNLDATLTRLQEAGLQLKRPKFSFLLPSVEYLGYKISEKGLQPTEDKVKAVHKAPAPEDVSQLKSFLGLVNYYGKFLLDLSTVLAPLYKLLQKDTRWSWGEVQQKPFEMVRSLLTSNVCWCTTILTMS